MDSSSPASRAAVEADVNRTISISSLDFEQKRLSSALAGSRNGSRAGSRAASTSYTPSFMSHHATQSTERVPTPTSLPTEHRRSSTAANLPFTKPRPTTNSSQPPGVLLLLLAAAIPPLTLSHLEMLLERNTFSTIAVAASAAQEMAVKQLRMDVYALIGSMGKELRVSVYTRDELNWSEIGSITKDATKNGESLRGVLCSPHVDAGATDVGILDIGDGELQHSWKQGTLFLHASIKACVQGLLSTCTPEMSKSSALTASGPFFLVATPSELTAVAKITKAANDELVHQLETATRAQGLTVGYTESVLVPGFKAETPSKETPLTPDAFVARQQHQTFTLSESPTKLWNMWALQNDI